MDRIGLEFFFSGLDVGLGNMDMTFDIQWWAARRLWAWDPIFFGLLLFGCVKDTSVLYGDERAVLH
jgi:hypothetical protein